MEKKREKLLETFHKTFPGLTDENKSAILDMTRFLVTAQNLVVPAMLNRHVKNAGGEMRDAECFMRAVPCVFQIESVGV